MKRVIQYFLKNMRLGRPKISLGYIGECQRKPPWICCSNLHIIVFVKVFHLLRCLPWPDLVSVDQQSHLIRGDQSNWSGGSTDSQLERLIVIWLWGAGTILHSTAIFPATAIFTSADKHKWNQRRYIKMSAKISTTLVVQLCGELLINSFIETKKNYSGLA